MGCGPVVSNHPYVNVDVLRTKRFRYGERSSACSVEMETLLETMPSTCQTS
jgi:hypothetical protein